MSFRTRPVLDRKHRPRWQDELRTQQLTIVAFAVAIALAVGIFGAAAWNGYWEAHFRPVASVAGTTFDRSDLAEREAIIAAETIAELTDLQAQVGGPRDQVIRQQMDSLSLRLSSLPTVATTSLVDAAVLSARAEEFGLGVSEQVLDAEILDRQALPKRVSARLILVEALPATAEPDAEATDAQKEEAAAAATEAKERVEGGEDFATVAGEVSDDATGVSGGALGWFGADNAEYAGYFEALADAEVGEIVGPVETESGAAAILELLEIREATAEGPLRAILQEQRVDKAAYREHVRGELLVDAYRAHFADQVVVSPAPQRRVAQIIIAPVTGDPIPQERARHVLISPLPGAADQSSATEEQFAAALTEAQEVRDLLAEEDADWFEIAAERSDDTGSGARGGDLGWYDPDQSPYVEEFAEALEGLDVGELSEPVRTQFGYHIIQKTGSRESPAALAAELVDELRGAPETFAEVASRLSDDPETAREDGELGWVAPYQLDPRVEEVVFGLEEVDEVSDVLDLGAEGISIYKLLETSESRQIEADRLVEIQESGFDRWLSDEVRAPVPTWIDPQFASTAV